MRGFGIKPVLEIDVAILLFIFVELMLVPPFELSTLLFCLSSSMRKKNVLFEKRGYDVSVFCPFSGA